MSKDKDRHHIASEQFEGAGEKERRVDKVKVTHTTNLEFQTALNVLQQIIETARDGNFMVESDGKALALIPASEVELEIKAKEKDGRQSVTFGLAWPSGSAAQATGLHEEQIDIAGDVCVADQMRMNRAAAEEEEAQLERRFEQEFFGSCGCVEVPGPELEQKKA